MSPLSTFKSQDGVPSVKTVFRTELRIRIQIRIRVFRFHFLFEKSSFGTSSKLSFYIF
jgi:hypothetical protein